jgi:xylulokinase
MLLLGIDVGTSSIKVSVVDAGTQRCLAAAVFPETEAPIHAIQPGWAEQKPASWWDYVTKAILQCHSTNNYDPQDIVAIGIAYQMHGLVITDKKKEVLRDAIIWCDSRAVQTGQQAFSKIGESTCLAHFLNSPANFTASKLAWVKNNEPAIYSRVDKMMLPGDYICLKLTGEVTTTTSALSEAILWDFQQNEPARRVMEHFEFDPSFIPAIRPVFSTHGTITRAVAEQLKLKKGIPVTYKAGDQLNNALALNVFEPGEVAATAGTSGVIYAVTDELSYDPQLRVNSFAHINHSAENIRIGVLLCINGAGIFNRWMKNIVGAQNSYEGWNQAAAMIPIGAGGLFAIPFGNGAERMLNNQAVGAHFHGLDFNVHTAAHMMRSVQEGIAFAFRYGFDIMRSNGINPSVIRAARTNLFLSDVFTKAFAGVNNISVELYEGDGSYGAAIGAGLGAGIYKDPTALKERKPVASVNPADNLLYDELFEKWKARLNEHLDTVREEAAFEFSIP